MKIPHPIPYQGSKRNLAKDIVKYIPIDTLRLVEPFAGSGAISIAVAKRSENTSFLLNDFNKPLMKLLENMITNPDKVISRYEQLWNEQLSDGEHYMKIRNVFNKTQEPEILLYLLARCVKNAVRYNNKGEFNQSADKRRKGRSPTIMKREVNSFNSLMKDRTKFISEDYELVLRNINKNDVVYMDPPYMGTTGSSKRYIQGLDLDRFIKNLEYLNKHKISFIVSFDGKTGEKVYGKELPKHLNLYKMELFAGKSSQATLSGRSEKTYESLYLSKELINRLGITLEMQDEKEDYQKSHQLELDIQ